MSEFLSVLTSAIRETIWEKPLRFVSLQLRSTGAFSFSLRLPQGTSDALNADFALTCV